MDLLGKSWFPYASYIPQVTQTLPAEGKPEDSKMNRKLVGEGKRTDSSNSGGNSVSIPDRVWLTLAKNKYRPSPLVRHCIRLRQSPTLTMLQ